MADFTEDYKIFLEKLGGSIEIGMEFLFKIFDYIIEHPLEVFKLFFKKYGDLVKKKLELEDRITKYSIKYGVLND